MLEDRASWLEAAGPAITLVPQAVRQALITVNLIHVTVITHGNVHVKFTNRLGPIQSFFKSQSTLKVTYPHGFFQFLQ